MDVQSILYLPSLIIILIIVVLFIACNHARKRGAMDTLRTSGGHIYSALERRRFTPISTMVVFSQTLNTLKLYQ